ncbi:glycosyltransferase [Salisediminibacterium beveridgei]|nr:glycosyltransferase [Salisediminibacterium beveridgei]
MSNEHDEFIESLKNSKKTIQEDYLRGLASYSKLSFRKYTSNYYEQYQLKGKVNFKSNMAKAFDKHKDEFSVNGSKVYQQFDLKIGLICDEFLYHALKNTADVRYIPRGANLIDYHDLDFVVIVSAWKGVDLSWKGLGNPESQTRQDMYELMDYFKARDIPVIYYSKEDPVNFEIFAEMSLRADFIFTSAEESVADYQELTGHDRISVMDFAVNPAYHNPVGTRTNEAKQRKDEVVFAGSWYEKYPVRQQETRMIFDGVLEAGKALTIIDRNMNLNVSKYRFPAKYIPCISEGMAHEELQRVHKFIPWAVNMNSVKYSNTMFANRIYELQAFGNLIISNYSLGVNNKFPNVFMAHAKDDVIRILNGYPEKHLMELRAKGIRQVMLNETSYHRIAKISETAGLKQTLPNPKIGVILEEESPELLVCFEQQRYSNLVRIDSVQDVVENPEIDFYTRFSKAFHYESAYVEDLLSAFAYTDVDFVTKEDTFFVHTYVTKAKNDELTLYHRDALTKKKLQGYLLDYAQVAYHKSLKVKQPQNPELSIIIPVYNNGRYLEDKCINSLIRSSMFHQMELIIVDDGSTCEETKMILNELQRKYNHIRFHRFDAPSGSASRPRNKGMSLATAPYLTFLDPDNEATGDGYSELLKALKNDKKADMIVGNVIKENDQKKSIFQFWGYIKHFSDDPEAVKDPVAFLKASNLKSHSIQAVIVKKHIIDDHQLTMVDGAIGQDTLFFHELLVHSRKTIALDLPIHVYYAGVQNSVTNTISAGFYRKYALLEKERIQFLNKHQLMDTYLEDRFSYYFRNWYLEKLKKVKPEERNEAIDVLMEIFELYRPMLTDHHQEIIGIMDNLKENDHSAGEKL